MFNEAPVELGFTSHEEEILDRLRSDRRYQEMFRAVFPGLANPIRIETVVKAIATFERTLLSGNSPFDRYASGEAPGGLSPEAEDGLALFYSERLSCFRCHAGFNFSGPVQYHEFKPERLRFHNTGLYNLGGRYPEGDPGLFEHSGRRRDLGKFRAPTLRNVALTSPYMHDGSVATLEDVIEHYAAGGRAAHRARGAGIGRRNPYTSKLVRRQNLSERDKNALLAFLKSLTDREFVTDPRFGNPWRTTASAGEPQFLSVQLGRHPPAYPVRRGA